MSGVLDCWPLSVSQCQVRRDRGEHTLGAEELSRDVESLAADDNDLLTVKELLGHNGRKTAKEMTLAIDDDLYHKLVSCLPS